MQDFIVTAVTATENHTIITDRPDMTSAVDHGRKALTQTKQTKTDGWTNPNQQIES